MCEKTNIRPPSKATMKIQWIPYMYADDGSNAGADKKKHHKCDVIMSRLGVSNLKFSSSSREACLRARS